MSQGFYNSVAAMSAHGRRLESVAHNLANASTPGYKRMSAHAETFRIPDVRPAGASAPGTPPRSSLGRDQVRLAQRTDFSQGELERTGGDFDLAFLGEGFFVVETPRGEAYTRFGAFELDSQGTLVTRDGHPVAWAGAIGRVDPLAGPITVQPDGRVFQGPTQVGQLELANFEDPSALSQGSAGLFVDQVGLRRAPVTGELHQGALEASNANPLTEMVELIEVQRSFQFLSRVLSGMSETYDRLANAR